MGTLKNRFGSWLRGGLASGVFRPSFSAVGQAGELPQVRRLPTRTSRHVLTVLLAFALLAAGLHPTAPSEASMQDVSQPIYIGPGETLTVGPGEQLHQTGPIILYGNGRLLVNGGQVFLDGSLWIDETALVDVSAGELHLQGNDTHIAVKGGGTLRIRDQSLLHYAQTYYAQHVLYASDQGRVEFQDSRFDCDQSAGAVYLVGEATFQASGSSFDNWNTFYMWNQSHLELDGVVGAGDIVYYDSVSINVRNTLGIMPWIYLPAGAEADLTFPEASHCDATDCPRVSLHLDNTVIPGVRWSLDITDSALVLWGVHVSAGSNVTVRDSRLAMALVPLMGDRFYMVPGEFQNRSLYDDKTFTSVPDRMLRLVNTSVDWWKVDAKEEAHAIVDGIVFAEMVAKNNATVLVTNSICEGQTIHVGALDRSYLYYKDGEVWSFVSAWNDATLVLDNTLVDYHKGQYIYQTTNIAHDRARLYAINSTLVSPPQAMDSALAMFARLGPLGRGRAAGWVEIAGSAWIEAGPESSVTFDRYTLAIRAKGGTNWFPFYEGRVPVRPTDGNDGTLGWLAAGFLRLKPGLYEIQLRIWVRGDPLAAHPTHDYEAVKSLQLF